MKASRLVTSLLGCAILCSASLSTAESTAESSNVEQQVAELLQQGKCQNAILQLHLAYSRTAEPRLHLLYAKAFEQCQDLLGRNDAYRSMLAARQFFSAQEIEEAQRALSSALAPPTERATLPKPQPSPPVPPVPPAPIPAGGAPAKPANSVPIYHYEQRANWDLIKAGAAGVGISYLASMAVGSLLGSLSCFSNDWFIPLVGPALALGGVSRSCTRLPGSGVTGGWAVINVGLYVASLTILVVGAVPRRVAVAGPPGPPPVPPTKLRIMPYLKSDGSGVLLSYDF